MTTSADLIQMFTDRPPTHDTTLPRGHFMQWNLTPKQMGWLKSTLSAEGLWDGPSHTGMKHLGDGELGYTTMQVREWPNRAGLLEIGEINFDEDLRRQIHAEEDRLAEMREFGKLPHAERRAQILAGRWDD